MSLDTKNDREIVVLDKLIDTTVVVYTDGAADVERSFMVDLKPEQVYEVRLPSLSPRVASDSLGLRSPEGRVYVDAFYFVPPVESIGDVIQRLNFSGECLDFQLNGLSLPEFVGAEADPDSLKGRIDWASDTHLLIRLAGDPDRRVLVARANVELGFGPQAAAFVPTNAEFRAEVTVEKPTKILVSRYSLTGLTWNKQAKHSGIIVSGNSVEEFRSICSLKNNGSTSIENATVILSGQTRVEYLRSGNRLEWAGCSTSTTQERVGETVIHALPNPVTLFHGQSVNPVLARALGPFPLRRGLHISASRETIPAWRQVALTITFLNSPYLGLGDIIPGPVEFKELDSRGHEVLGMTGYLQAAPIGGEASFNVLGGSRDVRYKVSSLSYTDLGAGAERCQEEWQIEVENFGQQPTNVDISFDLGQNAVLAITHVSDTGRFSRTDGKTLLYKNAPVPASTKDGPGKLCLTIVIQPPKKN